MSRSATAPSSHTTTSPSPSADLGHDIFKWPQFLPGGKAVLYSLGTHDMSGWDEGLIAVHSLETGEQKILLEGGSGARYAHSGHILYGRAGALWGVPFDLENLEVTGSPFRVLDGMRTNQTGGDPDFAVSRDGTLVFLPGGPQPETSLVWVDRQGMESPITTPEGHNHQEAAVSPDGRKIALGIGWKNHNVWIYDLERGTLDRLTHHADQHRISWTPDGRDVLFDSSVTNPRSLFRMAADGSQGPERLVPDEREQYSTSISPDGAILAYGRQGDSAADRDIYLYRLDGASPPRAFLATEFLEAHPQFSPDGRLLAYSSRRTGRSEVYVTPFPGPGEQVLVSREGGDSPRWSPEGRELFFRSPGTTITAVDIEAEPVLRIGRTRPLFSGQYWGRFGVSPDGQRFVRVRLPTESHPNHLNVVSNWTALLDTERAPSR